MQDKHLCGVREYRIITAACAEYIRKSSPSVRMERKLEEEHGDGSCGAVADAANPRFQCIESAHGTLPYHHTQSHLERHADNEAQSVTTSPAFVD